MRKRVARALRLAVVLALVLAMTGSSALASKAVVFNQDTKVYQTWSTSARSVDARKGLQVELKAYKNGWAMIGYKGYTGFVPLKYLNLSVPLVGYAATTASVYQSPGANYMGSINRGTAVYVVGYDGGYWRCQNKSGTITGYIRKGDLSKTRPVSASLALPAYLYSTSPSKSNPVECAIYVAQNLIGTPYSSSATPPYTFDCAKFLYYCYAVSLGSVLRSTSYDQGYDSRYTAVAMADLKRGDLVFFDTVDDGDYCDHVGLYVGGGYFIHASSTAREVIVSQLASGYYNRTFSWGRRIVG